MEKTINKRRCTTRYGCFLLLAFSLLLSEAGMSSAIALEPITVTEMRSLLGEFQKAQASETRSLEHQQKFEIKELKASQKARQREWETKEKEARHRFFAENREGPKRRAYVKDFLERRKALLSGFLEERNRRLREHEVRRKAIKDDQKLKAKQFQEILSRKERPSKDLWPAQSGF